MKKEFKGLIYVLLLMALLFCIDYQKIIIAHPIVVLTLIGLIIAYVKTLKSYCLK